MFFHLKNISKIQSKINYEYRTILHACISSRPDYCNRLFNLSEAEVEMINYRLAGFYLLKVCQPYAEASWPVNALKVILRLYWLLLQLFMASLQGIFNNSNGLIIKSVDWAHHTEVFYLPRRAGGRMTDQWQQALGHQGVYGCLIICCSQVWLLPRCSYLMWKKVFFFIPILLPDNLFLHKQINGRQATQTMFSFWS